MKTYRVTVLIRTLEFYQVQAHDEAQALDSWMEGRFLGSDDNLDNEPLRAVEVQP